MHQSINSANHDMGSPQRPDTTMVHVPRAADLDTWSGREWTNGLQVDDLPSLEHLVVRTRNTTYEITILSPQTGEVMVRGGRFFPEPTRVRLTGASLGGSFLKMRGIYIGFGIELWHDGESVVTSPVRSIVAAELPKVQ
jgi:hypothetical protein